MQLSNALAVVTGGVSGLGFDHLLLGPAFEAAASDPGLLADARRLCPAMGGGEAADAAVARSGVGQIGVDTVEARPWPRPAQRAIEPADAVQPVAPRVAGHHQRMLEQRK